MDLSRLYNIKVDLPPSNETINSLPTALLEAFIPGYALFHQLISRTFHLDIGLLVSGLLILFCLTKAIQYIYDLLSTLFATYFISTITIQDTDILFQQTISWLGDQPLTARSRDLQVASYDLDLDEEDNPVDADVLDANGIFNYAKWLGGITFHYTPNYGTSTFTFDSRRYTLTRHLRPSDSLRDTQNESLSIRCTSRTTSPIKALLTHIKTCTLSKEKSMTSIFRPNRDAHWSRQSCRPSRPLRTVSLAMHHKACIVGDVNEFLHPATMRWYAARGIPYRRGYLFHGPPGTGKTSMSFALAGLFGLDIYVISLMDVGLSESDLNTLFRWLPRRCVVLLEDIDAAGLTRAEDVPDVPVMVGDEEKGKGAGDAATAVSSAGRKSSISLSGLLNTIDGAASHEGRVLVMTTNFPEKLDPALVRPGRVDLQVGFSLATHGQCRKLIWPLSASIY
jgi:chaperone BCS1